MGLGLYISRCASVPLCIQGLFSYSKFNVFIEKQIGSVLKKPFKCKPI